MRSVLVAAALLLASGCTPGGPPAPTSTPGTTGVGVGTPSATASGPPAIPCQDSIDHVDVPPDDLEVVLDAVALPTRHPLQANETNDPPGWLFAKYGLVVRWDATVQLLVDDPARGHARIGWGSPGRTGQALRYGGCGFPGCDRDCGWLVYAGGYTVDAPACVPVLVRSGGREARVRVGVGTRCV
jgi:hypothetical protein